VRPPLPSHMTKPAQVHADSAQDAAPDSSCAGVPARDLDESQVTLAGPCRFPVKHCGHWWLSAPSDSTRRNALDSGQPSREIATINCRETRDAGLSRVA